jgi:hypothetical protein
VCLGAGTRLGLLAWISSALSFGANVRLCLMVVIFYEVAAFNAKFFSAQADACAK